MSQSGVERAAQLWENGSPHSPQTQKAGVCLHLQPVRMYSWVNSHSVTLFLSLHLPAVAMALKEACLGGP